MKLLVGVLLGVGAVVVAVLRPWQLFDGATGLPGIIADCRRSWKVAALWLACFVSLTATAAALAIYHPPWVAILPGAVAVVTFIYANLLSEWARPSPFYSDRYPDEPQDQAHPTRPKKGQE